MKIRLRPRSRPRRFALILISLLGTQSAFSGDYRFIAGLGFGGSGISQNSTENAAYGTIKRSEGPGVIDLSVERILSDRFTLALDHSRGFRLGPFSSGVSFTGFYTRYFLRAVPWGAKESKGETTIFVSQLNYFVGLGAGLATGTIDRPGDVVPSVTGSGIFVGLKLGADIPMNPRGMGIRPEFTLAGTFSSSKPDPTALSIFSVGCGWYIQF